MRKALSMGLVLALTAVSYPAGLLASQQSEQQTATLTGTARSTSGQALPAASVQIRNFGVGEIVARVVSGPGGEFVFEGLAPGRYVVEVVDAGKVVGMSSVFRLNAGMSLAMEVVVVSPGALEKEESDRAGFSLFGLGPATSAAVLGAAGAVAVTAVVSTRQEASPSR